MGKEFETQHEAVVDATPEQVWAAIATGPGISSWFVGRTQIDDGVVSTNFGDGWIPAGAVTVREEPRRFAYGSEPAPDGRFVASEYLIEGRDRSATVLRAVTSGFLPGDDWAGEFEAMQLGNAMFFATLVEYLRHFPAQVATPVTAFGPPVTDWPAAWAALHANLGLGASPRAGDPVPGGGEVFFVNEHTLGLRTPTGLYRYLRGFHGAMVVIHELFGGDAEFPTEIG
ncbi:SRPBCC domain-containing protein [Actinoplanes sp. NPDC026619]|uniref:SRPBCC family protein n=1 Tax=Actinoplanes sp. NPDC026619 TaxID=3155798 RepID=UPI0033C72971